MKREENIFIIGNPCFNIGDEAAMIGIISGLRRVCKGCFNKLYISISGKADLPEVDDVVSEDTFFTSKKIISYFFNTLLNSNKKPSVIFNDSSLIILSPAACGLHKYNKSHWYKVLLLIILCKIKKKKILFHGCSMGPFEKKQYRLLKHIINGCDSITVRDNTTLELLKQTRLHFNKEVIVASDSALMIRPALNKKNISVNNKLSFSLTTFDTTSFIGSSNINNQMISSIFSKVLNNLYQDGILGDLIIISHLKNNKAEHDLQKSIINELDPGISVRTHDCESASEAFTIYDSVDICIAARHHAAAFSLMTGTPAVCIAYEHKAHGFYKQCDLEKFVIDIDKLTFGNLEKMIRDVIEQYNDITDQILSYMPDMISCAEISSQEAKKLLEI